MKTFIGKEPWIKACSFYLRMEVFVKGLNITLEDEFDQYDEDSETIYLIILDGDTVAASGRLQRKTQEIGRLERICVNEKYRKQHLGETIITTLEKLAKEQQYVVSEIHALLPAVGFYKKLGYELQPGVYMEDGCECQTLQKTL